MSCDKRDDLKRTAILLLVLSSGCARFAVNRVGDALAGGGTTFAGDNDPDLIRQAVPFGLKMQESLLAKSPRHRGLLLATASGFTQYAFAFVQQDADELEGKDLAAATALRARARKLYLRARDYGLRGLAGHAAGKSDVPFLYWTAAAWGSAIAISKDQPDVVADVPKVESLIEKALALDESYEHGAIHGFLISYEMARPGLKPEEAETRARNHFDRAMELSEGKLAAPLVAYAEAVCVQKQQRAEFEKLLNQALAIDADQMPETRLANLVMQRRARWLLSRMDELFS